MITRPTHESRITLTQSTLKIKNAGSLNETHVENEEAFRHMLWNYFAIELDMDRKFSERN